jgi:hypothetical protein
MTTRTPSTSHPRAGQPPRQAPVTGIPASRGTGPGDTPPSFGQPPPGGPPCPHPPDPRGPARPARPRSDPGAPACLVLARRLGVTGRAVGAGQSWQVSLICGGAARPTAGPMPEFLAETYAPRDPPGTDTAARGPDLPGSPTPEASRPANPRRCQTRGSPRDGAPPASSSSPHDRPRIPAWPGDRRPSQKADAPCPARRHRR